MRDDHVVDFPDNDRMVSLSRYQINGLYIAAEWNTQSVVQPKHCHTRLSALQYLKILIDNEIAKEMLDG